MADQVIDRLVSSLAAGLIGTDEFIDAVQSQVGTTRATVEDQPEADARPPQA